MPPAPLDLPVADTGVVLRQLLQHGSMHSRIYRAEHPEHGITVCKIIPVPPDDGEAARVRRYVDDEASFNRRLESPQIRRLLDHGVLDTLPVFGYFEGAYWLLFEWVPSTLPEVLAEGLPSPRQVLRLAYALAAGLRVAHDWLPPIVHRDLKPQNVLVADPRDLATAKLADFGIARMAGSGGQTTVWAGTDAYMAPEQFENSSNVDRCADIYALALLSWQCLTGSIPLFDEHGVERTRALRRSPSLDELRVGDVRRPRLLEMFRWALDADPTRRPRSTEEFVRGIAHAGETDGLWSDADTRDAAKLTLDALPDVPRIILKPEQGFDERSSGGALELRLPPGAAGVLERLTPDVEWTFSLRKKQWSTTSSRVGVAEVTRIFEALKAREQERQLSPDDAASPPQGAPPSTHGERPGPARGRPSATRGDESFAVPPTDRTRRVAEPPPPQYVPGGSFRPSPELAEIIGAQPLARFEVANLVWAYINANHLRVPGDPNAIRTDEKLKAVFGGKDRITVREFAPLLARHLRDA